MRTSNKHYQVGYRKGFSLIEVMVAITIIGILLSIIYINFSAAQSETRNRSWQVELKELELALEVYKSQNGVYPPAQFDSFWAGFRPPCFDVVVGGVKIVGSKDTEAGGSRCPDNIPIIEDQTGEITHSSGDDEDVIGFGSTFIDALPNHDDSSNPNCEIVYKTPDNENRSWYKLSAVNCLNGVDATTGTQPDDELALCPESCGTCDGAPTNAAFYNDAAFFESVAIYSPGGRCE